MHFGRVEDLAGIDLSIPDDALRTQKFLRLTWKGRGNFHVGCPVWACAAWVGSLYPAETKAQDFLAAYAEQLGTVELNSTFYHLMDAKRIDAWRRAVPASFKFCPKVFRGITEQAGAPDLPSLIEQCAHGFEAFGDTLGLSFMQFPETFDPSHMPLLRRVLHLWPKTIPLAIELRHAAWFRSHALLDEVVDLFYRNQVTAVITDTPGRRHVLHTSLTWPRVMLRFQGHALDPSDAVRLSAWADRLIAWAGSGLEDIYVFCHQPEDDSIPETVNIFLRALQMRGVIEPSPWRDHSVRSRKRGARGEDMFTHA